MLKANLMWNVYLTNFMPRRRQTRTQRKKKNARVEKRVESDEKLYDEPRVRPAVANHSGA